MAVILALARSLLLAQEPERAHMRALAWTSRLQATGLLGRMVRTPAPFPSRVFGLDFPNPVGLAAGLDKDGAHVDALFALGFGFVEVGTVTPLPQPGNPQPRLFRLPEHQAVINRMGFNNAGVEQLARNIEASRFARAATRQGVLGINIGKNKDTPNAQAAQDYLTCLERIYPLADYVTVNISSPNTAGLRELQEEQSLRRLVETLQEARERLSTRHGRQVPVLVKISPDLSDFDIDAVARVFNDTRVDGVIATNTTIARGEVQGSPLADEQGGLSGEPLLERSTATLRRLRSRMDETIPIIGVGGVTRGADAVAKTAAGAALVQVYTGLIYRGPRLVRECVDAIRRRKVARASGTAALK